MSATLDFHELAALTDSGVLLHDVMGAVTLLILLIGGAFFRKRQGSSGIVGMQKPSTTAVDRQVGRFQLWVLYWVVILATIAFFFVMPRATSQKAQMEPKGEKDVPRQPQP